MYSLTKRNGSTSTYDILKNNSVLQNSIFLSGIAIELHDKTRCSISDHESMAFAKSPGYAFIDFKMPHSRTYAHVFSK